MIVLSSGWSLITVLALAAADRYTFRRLLIANALLTLAGILLARGRLRLGGRTLSYTSLLPLALAIFCALRFTPAAEYIMGGKDPGTYVNEGIQIAQRGSIRSTEPVVATVPTLRARPVFPASYARAGAAAHGLLRDPLHGFPPAGSGHRRHRRTVSASVSSVDRDRLRFGRAQRGSPGHAVLGDSGCAGRVLRRGSFIRPSRCLRGRRLARVERRHRVVRALSKRRSRDAGVSVRSPARQRTRTCGWRPLLRTRRGGASLACCSSCASTRCSASPVSLRE